MMVYPAEPVLDSSFYLPPLHHAVFQLQENEVKTLVENGVDINEPAGEGLTALHISVRNDCSSVITELLIAAGADIGCKTSYGFTPLHESVRNCSVLNTKLLLKHSVNFKTPDYQGLSPLDWAIYNLMETMHGDSHLIAIASKILEELLDWATPYSKESMSKIYLMFDFYSQLRAVRVVSRHSLKLKCANLPYDDRLLWDEVKLISYKSACLVELVRMKCTKVDGHSLYCVFSSCISVLSVTDMVNLIWTPEFLKEFPIYGSLMQAKFTKKKKRHDLLNLAEESLTELFVNSEIFIPDMVIRKILSYISNEDLQGIIVT
ncbi:delta-latroinsectotoxin-Lt1a-like [Homalodisca vitripennis]|uniref:delta-latroinsectotoxin-Lt1a-like n=1 Tax=Homalodisca vitripennis TaxID=197043 RepID=UPI001EEBC636|nr:delta-latroinsectotoxin-Lt1a-like [Homalodisca vitripennis]